MEWKNYEMTFSRKGYGRIFVENESDVQKVEDIIRELDEYEFDYYYPTGNYMGGNNERLVTVFSEENYKRLLDVFSIECLVHLEQYIILTILLSWLMILFKLMRKRNMNTDVCQNFTHSVFHDVNRFFAESDNRFKYWKNIFSSFLSYSY